MFGVALAIVVMCAAPICAPRRARCDGARWVWGRVSATAYLGRHAPLEAHTLSGAEIVTAQRRALPIGTRTRGRYSAILALRRVGPTFSQPSA